MKTPWILTFLCCLMFCRCATTHSKRQGWASGKWWPSCRQWRNTASNAVIHPGTWVPAMGAVVIAAGGWDEGISDWAIEETPIFGSRQAAQDASDILLIPAHIGMMATALAVPSGDEPWLSSMAWRMAWEHLGVIAASCATDPLKSWTDRDRPNGRKRSFPSRHATISAAYASMAYRNLKLIDMKPCCRHSAQLTLVALAVGTAWARVEASQHYPTDVLAGAALGNFLAVLIHDAFLSRDEETTFSLRTGADGCVILNLLVSF